MRLRSSLLGLKPSLLRLESSLGGLHEWLLGCRLKHRLLITESHGASLLRLQEGLLLLHTTWEAGHLGLHESSLLRQHH